MAQYPAAFRPCIQHSLLDKQNDFRPDMAPVPDKSATTKPLISSLLRFIPAPTAITIKTKIDAVAAVVPKSLPNKDKIASIMCIAHVCAYAASDHGAK